MSETETSEDDVVQTVREAIDDVIDKLENHVAKLPVVPRTIATSAIGVLRGILQIPDDIGGDED